MKEQAINKATEIVALYATMISGHLTKSGLPIEEQIAGIICAGDLVTRATALATEHLCVKHGVGPAWTMTKEQINRASIGYSERMVGDG